jgi:hypothetical protein
MNSKFMSRKTSIYTAAGVLTLALTLFHHSSDDAGAALARTSAKPSPADAPGQTRSTESSALLPRLARRSAESTMAGDLFASSSWTLPPPPLPPPPPPPRPAAPTAPPLPFTFLGSFAAEGAPATFFLTRGDRVYDVKVGDTVDSDYTLDALEGSNLIFTYKPLQTRQSLGLGGPQ